MRESEFTIQAYLANREAELGEFTLLCILAKISNHASFVRLKKAHTAKELFTMTPQEELFRDFFNNEKTLVKNMTILELRAHREELAKIAFEARARLTAADEEEKTRSRAGRKEPTGFSTSVQTDELTTNAINNINNRKQKMSKDERTLAGLVKLLGGDEKAAQSLMTAGAVLGRIKASEAKKAEPKPIEAKSFTNPFSQEVVVTEISEVIEEPKPEPKPFVNPFE